MGRQNPVRITDRYEPLGCMHCGKDLLAMNDGVFVFVEEPEEGDSRRYELAYWACKRECDDRLGARFMAEGYWTTSWVGIQGLTNPLEFFNWHMRIMNGLYRGHIVLGEEAFEKIKQLELKVAQFVVRGPTTQERASFWEIDELRRSGLS